MRIFGHRFEKNSLLYWIFPYIICILISVILSSLSYYQAVGIISDQTKKAHEESVVAISDKIEPLLSGANAALMQIISSENIETLCEEKIITERSHYYTIGQLQTELQEAVSKSNIVKSAYVYFPEAEFLMSVSDLYIKEDIKNHLKEEYKLSNEDIRKLLDSTCAVTYRLIPSPGGTRAFLIHALPFDGKYEKGTVILISLNTSALLESLSVHSQTEGRFAAIIDKDNTILLSGTWPDRRITYQNNGGEAASTEYGLGSGRIFASGIASKVSGWEYVTGIPYSILMDRMNHVLAFIVFFVLLGILAGIAAAYYFAKKSYTSMDNLMRKFMDSLSVSRKEGFSFLGLEKMLEDLISERKNLYRSFDKYRDAAREHVLLKLLGGSTMRASELHRSLDELKIDLRGGRCVLLVISVDDFSHVFFDGKADEDENIFELINLIISNVTSEIVGKEFPAYMTEFMGYNVCVMNLKDSGEDWRERVRKIAERSIDFIRTNFGIMLSAMVSRECAGLDKIHGVFVETVNHFDMFDHDNTVYIFSEDDNFADYSDDRKSLEMRIREKAHRELESEIDRLYISDIKVYKRLKTAVQSMKPEEAKPDPEDRSSQTRWVQEICDYIDKNYSDQALNISFFAYRFNMNSAYIGRRFKEVMGFGILEYIHKRRIEEAQRLIDSGLKLKDVAERVGFSNTLTMRRAFERYKKDSSINEIETEKTVPQTYAGTTSHNNVQARSAGSSALR